MKREFSAYLLLLSASASILSFVIPLYLKSVAGFSDNSIGVLFSIANLVSVFMLVIASAHSDVAGLRKYLLAFSASIVASSLVLFVPGAYFLIFLVSLTLVSLVTKSFYVFSKIITISRFTSEMAHVYGIFGVAISAGALLGPILGGNVVDSFGFHSSFLLSGAIAALSAIALSGMSEKSGRPHSELGFLKSLVESFRAFRFSVHSAAFVIYRTLYNVSFTMIAGFVLPLFMKGEFPDFFLAGLAVSAFSLGRMAGFGLGNYTDRHDFNKVNLLSLGLQAAFALALSFTGSWTSVGFLALSGVASGLAATSLPGFYSKISNKLVGRDIGLIDTMGLGIGSAIGAYLSGILASQFGYRSVFMWGALIGLLAALFIYPFFRKKLLKV